jgi:hypothetical protein
MFQQSSSFKAFSLILLGASWAHAQPSTPQSAAPSEEATAADPPSGASQKEGDSASASDGAPATEDTTSADNLAKDNATADAAGDSSDPQPVENKIEAPVNPTKEAPTYRGPATLLDRPPGDLHVGGYGGLSVHGTGINGTAGVLVGAEGAILLDHRFALGLAFHGLSSEVRGPAFGNGDASVLGFGYGGPVMRYQLMSPKSPVTLSVGALLGAGGLTLVRRLADNDYEFDETYAANAYFVAEPSAQVHLHLTRFMRIGVSGGYRFVVGPDLGVVTDSDLHGVTAGGHLQFGWF